MGRGVVAMSDARVKITYQDYLQLPDEQRYEVLEGDLRMVPAPGTGHQRILWRLSRAVGDFVEPQRLGRAYFAPVDVILDEDSVVQPDLLVVLTQNLARIRPEGVFGAPDLVVEILSPSNAHRDRGIKRRLYGRYGVQEYWIIDPQERTVEVTSLRDGHMETWSSFPAGATLRSPLFPAFTLPVDSIFAE
jgi:Uma2 family endonuclease